MRPKYDEDGVEIPAELPGDWSQLEVGALDDEAPGMTDEYKAAWGYKPTSAG